MTTTVSQDLVPYASARNLLAPLTQARAYAEAAQAISTRRAYTSDLRIFTAFCTEHGLPSLPASPQTVARYVSDLAERAKISTIRRHLVAISMAHKERALENPATHEMVRRTVRGIARTLGSAPTKKSAITVDELHSLLHSISGTPLKVKRDRALILLGWSAALRRSEIAALDVANLHFGTEGIRLTLRRSKTDQECRGQEIAVPFVPEAALCATTAVREWLDAANIIDGPVFRSFTLQHELTNQRIDGRAVALLIQRVAGKAHLTGDYAGHSLRAGFITSAAQAGTSLDNIARTTRHRSMAVLSGYIRRANLFQNAALSAIVR